MLEIKVLKVIHYGEKEARKLIPHIENTDIYAEENAGATEEMARAHEKNWQWVINSSGWSFDQFVRNREAAQKAQRRGQDDGQYALFQSSYLFAEKVPIYVVERFSQAEHEKIMASHKLEDLALHEAVEHLGEGRVDQYIEAYKRSLQLGKEKDELRDRHIAKNLECAEAYLRGIYPSLSKKEPLRLTVSLGSLHSPEKYTSIPIELCSLVGDGGAHHTIDLIALMNEQDIPVETLNHHILVYGVKKVLSMKGIKIDLEKAMQMSYEELSRLLAK